MGENTSDNATGLKECSFCGEKILASAKKCKHCGEIVDVMMREMENLKKQQANTGPIILNNNNNNNNNSNNPNPGINLVPKSRTVYIILGLLWGVLGFHNFYAGYVGRGILQLIITCTGVGLIITVIWVLIEIIAVRTDARGLPFA